MKISTSLKPNHQIRLAWLKVILQKGHLMWNVLKDEHKHFIGLTNVKKIRIRDWIFFFKFSNINLKYRNMAKMQTPVRLLNCVGAISSMSFTTLGQPTRNPLTLFPPPENRGVFSDHTTKRCVDIIPPELSTVFMSKQNLKKFVYKLSLEHIVFGKPLLLSSKVEKMLFRFFFVS